MQNYNSNNNNGNKFNKNNNYIIIQSVKNDNKKSNSLPYVAINSTSNNLYNNLNRVKKTNKKKQPSVFQNGFLQFLNFKQNSQDQGEEGEIDDEGESVNQEQIERVDWTIGNDFIGENSKIINNKTNNESSSANYLTINRIYSNENKAAKSLTTSRNSLSAIDYNSTNLNTKMNGKLMALLTPTLGVKPITSYQKVRSKSEAILEIPEFLSEKKLESVNNDKRVSNAGQELLIKSLNSRLKSQNSLTISTSQKQKFSFKSLFKSNHQNQKRSQSMHHSFRDNSVSSNLRNSLKKRLSASTTTALKVSSSNSKFLQDGNELQSNVRKNSENLKIETNQVTDDAEPKKPSKKSFSNYKSKLNIFDILLHKKISQNDKTLSATNLCVNDDLNKESNLKRSFTMHQSFLSKFKNRKSAKSSTVKGKKEEITCFIDFQIKYDNNTKEINVFIANISTKPNIEVNKIKSKLTYICNIEKEFQFNSDNTSDDQASSMNSSITNSKILKKHFDNKLKKSKKIKFDPNMRNKTKKIKFSVFKQVFSKKNYTSETIILNSFVFQIEIHSYLPMSRKALSSTFRNNKRKYKGELIFENIELNCLNNFSFIQKDFKISEI